MKKREVLSVGIAESLTLAVQNLYLFLWTPILLASTDDKINIGFIFLCMVTSIIVGTKVFEIGVIYLRANLYVILSFCLFTIFSSLSVIYLVDNFLVRVIAFACLNGSSGLYNPLYSFIKYKILEDKNRALLMNIFRIPLNAYVIIVLLSLKFLNPFTVCLIAAGMSFVAFLIIFSLLVKRPHITDDLSVFPNTKLEKRLSMSSSGNSGRNK